MNLRIFRRGLHGSEKNVYADLLSTQPRVDIDLTFEDQGKLRFLYKYNPSILYLFSAGRK